MDGTTLYTGPRYSHYFAYEDVNRSGEGTTKPVVSTNPLGTPGNWLPMSGDKVENNLYFYVTGKDHTVTLNDKTYDCVWDSATETFTLTEKEEETVLYGDVNGDGKIRANDAMLVLQHVAMMDVTIDEAAADVSGDGKIRSNDAMLILQYVAMTIEEFPVVSNG